MTQILIQRLTKTYRMGSYEVHALRDVDISVDRGEYLSIMGPSGSGKSTLLNLLGCLDRPTSGVYELAGLRVSGMDRDQLAEARNRRIGFVFQTFNLLARSSALHNVEVPLLYAGVSRSERRRRAEEMLDRVGLSDRASHRPNELSGGQRQRVAVARALVNNPDILLADEPTGNLDTKTGEEIMDLFARLHDTGNTVLVVTHEEEIARRTNRTIRLRDGRIESDTRTG